MKSVSPNAPFRVPETGQPSGAKSAEVEEFCAARIARLVAEEIRLKDIADQTPTQFYLGTSISSGVLRSIAFLAFLLLLLRFRDPDVDVVVPLLAAAAVVEMMRLNRRIDALNRLFRIHAERSSTYTVKEVGGGVVERGDRIDE